MLALVAYLLARAFPWPAALAVALLAFAALVAYDVVLLRGDVEIVRVVPPRLALARRDDLRYEIANRTARERRVAIVEAPADRLAIDLAEARATLPPRTRATVTIGVLPRERGRTALRSYHARVLSRLGIVELRRTFRDPVALRVMPDLSALDRSSDLAARTKLIESGLRRLRRRGIGGEFESLREYTTDDPFRAIDWKATARRGKPMVAQYEVERAQQIVVAIDAGRLMAARLGDRRKLDYAVSAALAIAAIARLAADRVGVVAFAGERARARRAGQRRAAQRAAHRRAVRSRAALRGSRLRARVSRHRAHAAQAQPRRAVHRPVRSRRVERRARRGEAADHAPSRARRADERRRDRRRAAATPRDAEDAYRAAVAATLSDERARAVADLHNRGILVVDVPAAELSIALLDAYVDIKTRGLL